MRRSIQELRIGDPAPTPPEPPTESQIVANWQGNTSAPHVSVVCHTYNHAKFIRDALHGFLMQKTRFPFEIIVHDDASTDGTADILAQYAEEYPNLMTLILQSKNQFGLGNRPQKFSYPAAAGRYIAFCEGDDYWLDDQKIARQAALLDERPEISVCGHNALVFENGKLTGTGKLPAAHQRNFSAAELQQGRSILTVTAMFRNVVAEYAPEQAKLLNGDNLLFARLGKHGGYHYMPDIGPAAYRLHAQGLWSQLSATEKMAAQINTSFWIAQYFRRTGDSRLADTYMHWVAENALTNLSRIGIRDYFKISLRFFKVYLATRWPKLAARWKRLSKP